MHEGKVRYAEIDLLRGMAILGMIVYHSFFLLDFFGVAEFHVQEGVLKLLARTVQFLFLAIVGVSLAISRNRGGSSISFYQRQLLRASVIFLCAMIVTITTKLLIPDQYVRFGVLHFIAVAIVLLSSMARSPIVVGISAAVIFIASFFMNFISFDSGLFAIALGTAAPFATVDYFPLIPWLALPAIGIVIGNSFYPHAPFSLPDGSIMRSLNWLGRHALIIYMIHVPVLFGIIAVWELGI